MLVFPQGASDVSIYLPLVNTSNVALTGVAYDSAGAACYYLRPGGSPTQISLASLANAQAAHTDGGFVEVDGTNMPGLYRLDLPDAAVASGENSVVVEISFTSSARMLFLVNLSPEPSVISGVVVDDVANGAGTFKTDLAGYADDAFNGAWLLFRSGNCAGQVRQISDFNGTTQFPTVGTAYTEEPAAGDEFVIVNR